ncbi:MAG: DUF6206 family protein [Candidatus Iainarchaeum sp.]|jgi:hypothetical protein|nr:MAG: hypothetical protein BWY55_00653 [archaeon ADurb.Bin336]
MKSIQKRKMKKLGSGMFVTAKVILPTKRDATKRVSLAGKVFKKISGTYTLPEGIRTKKIILEYLQKLGDARVKTLQTKVRLIKTPKNKLQLIMLQTQIAKEDLLINRIKKCSPTEALNFFEQMVRNIQKIEEYNKHHSAKIGLDIRLKNFGVINNELVLIDLYPAYLQGEQKIQIGDISQRKRGVIRKIKKHLSLKNVEKKAENTIRRRMDSKITMKEMIEKFISRRPELKNQFLQKYASMVN